jgi:hypothetical protein
MKMGIKSRILKKRLTFNAKQKIEAAPNGIPFNQLWHYQTVIAS